MKVIIGIAIVAIIATAMFFGQKYLLSGSNAIAKGQLLYADNCASCHGVNLEGQPDWHNPNEDGTLPAPPHNAEGHTWHHDDKLLFDYTKFGGAGAMAARGVENFNSAMPAFEGVNSDNEINDIWAYIKSTWSNREREAQAERTAMEIEAES